MVDIVALLLTSSQQIIREWVTIVALLKILKFTTNSVTNYLNIFQQHYFKLNPKLSTIYIFFYWLDLAFGIYRRCKTFPKNREKNINSKNLHGVRFLLRRRYIWISEWYLRYRETSDISVRQARRPAISNVVVLSISAVVSFITIENGWVKIFNYLVFNQIKIYLIL